MDVALVPARRVGIKSRLTADEQRGGVRLSPDAAAELGAALIEAAEVCAKKWAEL